MEIVAVVRLLWRRRLLVIAGAVVAVGIAFLLGPSPVWPSGLATTRVMFDTPRSQIIAGSPEGADSLPWRATMSASLLSTDAMRKQIANEVKIPLDQLLVTEAELTAPIVPASLPKAAAEGSNAAVAPYSLTVQTDHVLPIVSISTSAPDRAGAARLAEAAVHALQTGAPAHDTTELFALSVTRVATIDSVTIPGGPGRKKMALVAFVVFGLWCAGLTLGPALAGVTRAVREANAVGL